MRVATQCTSWSTRGAIIESLPGAILFSGVLPAHSFAVDDTKLCDLYVPQGEDVENRLLVKTQAIE